MTGLLGLPPDKAEDSPGQDLGNRTKITQESTLFFEIC